MDTNNLRALTTPPLPRPVYELSLCWLCSWSMQLNGNNIGFVSPDFYYKNVFNTRVKGHFLGSHLDLLLMLWVPLKGSPDYIRPTEGYFPFDGLWGHLLHAKKQHSHGLTSHN